MSFSDVPVGAPFRAEICWLTKQTGISTGYSDNTFRPSERVSRQAMAVFLYRTRFLDQLPYMTTVYEDGVVASS